MLRWAPWGQWHLRWAFPVGWAREPSEPPPWTLTSVGDDKDDVLTEGLGARQGHLGTELLHHVQGHLRGGTSGAARARPTPVPSPPSPWGQGRPKAAGSRLRRWGWGLSVWSPSDPAPRGPACSSALPCGAACWAQSSQGPCWRRGSLPAGEAPSLTVHVLILRWRSRPPGRRKSCLLELRPAWDRRVGQGRGRVPSTGGPAGGGGRLAGAPVPTGQGLWARPPPSTRPPAPTYQQGPELHAAGELQPAAEAQRFLQVLLTGLGDPCRDGSQGPAREGREGGLPWPRPLSLFSGCGDGSEGSDLPQARARV